MKLVLTCEHASNALPQPYRLRFSDEQLRLESHEGYDLGAFELFKALEGLADVSFAYPWSRLLIEVNRSLHHPRLFSSISKAFSKAEKKELVEQYYQVYRDQLQNTIADLISEGEVVLHLGIHSFTPSLNGVNRNADVGLLYDPQRKAEQEWAMKFKNDLKAKLPDLTIRMNYPYLGKADGLTTAFRKDLGKCYRGIEVEVNQKLLGDEMAFQTLSQGVFEILKSYKTKS